jgi:multiple sugar transport system substrate-binding protein
MNLGRINVTKNTLSRRDFGKLGLATAVGLSAPFIMTRSAFARDQKLVFWLQPNFNKAADELLIAQTYEYAKMQGLSESDVQIETIPGGEIAKRMAAAIEIGAPPDVTRVNDNDLTNWGAGGHLLDVTAVVEEMKAQNGGINENVLPQTVFDGANRAVPMGISPAAAHVRMDKFREAGYETFPDTWEAFAEAARKISKPPFYAYGMALGLTPSDSLGDVMSVVRSYGGTLVDANNRPSIQSDATVEAFKLINSMYNESNVIPKGVVSWDNSGNNKAFLSGQVAYVLNETSIYSSMIVDNNEFLKDTILELPPGGPAGRNITAYTNYYGVFKAAPNPDLAIGLVRHFMQPENYSKFVVGAGGRYLPIYPKQLEDQFWTDHPAYNGLRAAVTDGLSQYYPGRPSVALSEIVNRSLIVEAVQDMLVKGVEPARAAENAQKAMVEVFQRHGEAV